MPEEIVYRADNGMKMLLRTVMFGGFLLISLYFWSAAPIFFSFLIAFSVFQILLYKYSTIIVYKDKITYQNKNLLNADSEFGTLNYNELYELYFSPSEIDGSDLFVHGLIAALFPRKKNEIIAIFSDEKKKTMRWNGNVLEVQNACEKAHEIISQEFNRPKF